MFPNTNYLSLTTLNPLWHKMAPQLTSPVAASIAVIPVFYGFVAKSALQTNSPLPTFKATKVLINGLKASPTIGCVIGLQIFSQDVLEKLFTPALTEKKHSSFITMTTSSVGVAFLSVIPLAVFNGQSLNQSIIKTIRLLSLKQAAAIVTRETSFLFSLRVSGPIGQLMKEKMEDNSFIESSSIFATGVIGSLVGHPADTALTRLQKEMQLQGIRQLMKGSGTKAITIGVFTLIYQKTKK